MESESEPLSWAKILAVCPNFLIFFLHYINVFCNIFFSKKIDVLFFVCKLHKKKKKFKVVFCF